MINLFFKDTRYSCGIKEKPCDEPGVIKVTYFEDELFTGSISYLKANANVWEFASYLDGKIHSFDDEPALSDLKSNVRWFKNGLCHRETGPAIIYSPQTVGAPTAGFYFEGVIHTFDAWLEKLDVPLEEKVLLKLKWA